MNMRLHLPVTVALKCRGVAQRRFTHLFSKENVLVVGGGPVGSVFAYLCQEIFSIPVRVIERQMRPTTHPQAHFINLRTMEILYSLIPEFHHRVRELAAPALMVSGDHDDARKRLTALSISISGRITCTAVKCRKCMFLHLLIRSRSRTCQQRQGRILAACYHRPNLFIFHRISLSNC